VLEISRFSCMLFLSVRGFSDYAGSTVHSRLAWLPSCLPPTRNEVGILIYGLFAAQSPRPPMPLVYASRNTSRCPPQDSRSGWTRYFLSCRALASPTTCRFSPAHSVLPVVRPLPSAPHFAARAPMKIPFTMKTISLRDPCGEGGHESEDRCASWQA
jgi:hypothetical protein